VKRKAVAVIENKFILEPFHHVASVLNPKMKNLRMLSDYAKQRVYDTLRAMTAAILSPETQHESVLNANINCYCSTSNGNGSY